MRGDGSRPLCSGSQVRADNCRLCAAETDDYGLYCLSQAQSALIQQSHIALIYESCAPPPSHTPPPPYHTLLCSYACLCFPPLPRSPYPGPLLPSGRQVPPLPSCGRLAGAALACVREAVRGGVIATPNSPRKTSEAVLIGKEVWGAALWPEQLSIESHTSVPASYA